MSACVDFTLSPAELIEMRRGAAAGEVRAMLALANHYAENNAGEQRRWLAMAADHGDCTAVRELIEPSLTPGASSRERRHWQEVDRQRGCSIERWSSFADGATYYALPGLAPTSWVARIDCVQGDIEIAGLASLTPSETPEMIVRTSKGARRLPISRVEHFSSAMAFTVSRSDDLLSALSHAERVEFEFPGGQPWTVDGHGAAEHLQSLLARCTARAPAAAARAH